MSQSELAVTSLHGEIRAATPSLLFSIEVRELVWGVGILVSSPTLKETASLDLYPRCNQDESALPLPQTACETRGKLLLGVEWQKSSAKLELHSIRSISLPVSRLYELKGRPVGGKDLHMGNPALWTLQVWALPPASAESASALPVCKIEITEPSASSIPFAEHKLKLERPVEVFWPEAWLASIEAAGPKASTLLKSLGHVLNVAMRCRHAMFEGATENGATARSLKHWAELENWFLFGPRYARYDDELLPIDETTALHPTGEFALTMSDVLDLRQDDNYLFCHSSVVRFVLLSWGWDIETGELPKKDEFNGQGWIPSGRHAWRLRHLCLSCWLLGQDELRRTCRDFVMSLGADAPWAEDGFSEALFTLNSEAEAEEFWQLRAPPSPGLGVLKHQQLIKTLPYTACCSQRSCSIRYHK
eukprot:Skav207337  [mRNA]  locus=scaffold426:49126:50379:+ [translate_table: standard]